MKTYIVYLFTILSSVAMISCGNEYDVDEYFDLEELPGYVAFDAPGNNVTLDPVETTEDDGEVSLTVECPTGTLSDINVSYSLGGSAVFGTDYTIDGATASGGSLVIEHRPTRIQNPDRADIVITLLTDAVTDGEKTIEVTLTDASNADGDLAVGRGGTDFLKSATVIIADVD